MDLLSPSVFATPRLRYVSVPACANDLDLLRRSLFALTPLWPMYVDERADGFDLLRDSLSTLTPLPQTEWHTSLCGRADVFDLLREAHFLLQAAQKQPRRHGVRLRRIGDIALM